MRFLFTTFEGGGHVPPALLVARRLQARGHQVLVLSDEANRGQADAAGLSFMAWRRAPNRQQLAAANDPLDEWKSRWPPAIVKRLCSGVITGPSLAYAQDTLEVAEAFRPEVIVSNELLFGAMAAAEASGRRLALLTANVWCFPTRTDVPPFGPGFAPSAAPWAKRRDDAVRRLSARWYDVGLDDLNATRARLGLAPLPDTLAQLATARLVLLGVAKSFDYGSTPPAPMVHVGPLADAPAWAQSGDSDDPGEGTSPEILLSFSTTPQGQAALALRCAKAASSLSVPSLLTLGPALRGLSLPTSRNLTVVDHASHDEIVPRCRLVVTHAGHGTVIRPLIHGVPVLCVPTGRDQPENAARVVAAGAGMRCDARASVGRLRAAMMELLENPSYRMAARRLAAQLAPESDGGQGAALRLEAMAANAA